MFQSGDLLSFGFGYLFIKVFETGLILDFSNKRAILCFRKKKKLLIVLRWT